MWYDSDDLISTYGFRCLLWEQLEREGKKYFTSTR